MFVLAGFLMMITVGCCTNDYKLQIESVAVEQSVTLLCPRKSMDKQLFWIRVILGHQLEVLGGTFGFNYPHDNETPRFTTKQGPATFILDIHQAQMNDTGLYYCLVAETLNMTLEKAVFLKVQGPRSSVSSIVQAPPPDVVRPGESVSLQCSVLSDSERKTCPEDYRVFWFRPGSDQSHPSWIYSDGNDAECVNSSQKCFYSFSKNVSVSDAGTYYCAVAACGEVMFGNGANLDVKEVLGYTEIALCAVCAALAASVSVSVCLIWTIKKNQKSDT